MKKIFNIVLEFLKWSGFIISTYVIWLLLTIFSPQWVFVIYIYIIFFIIKNFPKALFALIITKFQEFKTDIDNEEELSAKEEFIYKGCIVASIFLFGLIIYIFFHNKNIENEIAMIKYKSSTIDLSMDPVQVDCKDVKPFTIKENGKIYNIKPLANYKIIGIVVAKNTFLFDVTAPIAPVDIGLVWGELAKPENYKHMKFYSNFRLLTYNIPNDFKLSKDVFQTHHSHNHIISATEEVKKKVMSLKMDDIVILKGYLVEVTGKTLGSPWKSSLRRDDHLFNSGAGCEIFYVEDITLL